MCWPILSGLVIVVVIFYFLCLQPFVRNKSSPGFWQSFLEETYSFQIVYRRNIPAEKRAHARYLHDEEHMRLKEIAQLCDFSLRLRIELPPKNYLTIWKKKLESCGCKRKLSLRQERLILCSITVLRERKGSFTSKQLCNTTEIVGSVIVPFAGF